MLLKKMTKNMSFRKSWYKKPGVRMKMNRLLNVSKNKKIGAHVNKKLYFCKNVY